MICSDARGGLIVLAMLVTSAGVGVGAWCSAHVPASSWARLARMAIEAAAQVR